MQAQVGMAGIVARFEVVGMVLQRRTDSHSNLKGLVDAALSGPEGLSNNMDARHSGDSESTEAPIAIRPPDMDGPSSQIKREAEERARREFPTLGKMNINKEWLQSWSSAICTTKHSTNMHGSGDIQAKEIGIRTSSPKFVKCGIKFYVQSQVFAVQARDQIRCPQPHVLVEVTPRR